MDKVDIARLKYEVANHKEVAVVKNKLENTITFLYKENTFNFHVFSEAVKWLEKK